MILTFQQQHQITEDQKRYQIMSKPFVSILSASFDNENYLKKIPSKANAFPVKDKELALLL